MAIAFGGSVGTPVMDTENAASTIALTTGTIPANSFIVMCVSWYAASGTASMGGGGLTWSGQDAFIAGTTDTSRHLAQFSAQNPSGISAQTLTATVPAGSFGRAIFGAYFTGIATSSAKDVASAGARGNGPAPVAWNSGSATTTVTDAVIVGGVWYDGDETTNTADGTDTEALDFNNVGAGANASWALEYRIVATTGSYDVGGTWGTPITEFTGNEWLSVMAAYKDAAAGGGGGGASPFTLQMIRSNIRLGP